jgi:tetratricopeptide (TPR) repeat protein
LLANLTAFESVDLELWAGDPVAADAFAAEGYGLHEELGDPDFLPDAAANRARTRYALGRLDEAERWADRAAQLSTSDRPATEMLWRRVRAKVAARRGEPAEAERLAREAVALGDRTEMLDAQADAWADLGEVLAIVGSPEAADAFWEALARYERKGNVVMADRMRARLREGAREEDLPA